MSRADGEHVERREIIVGIPGGNPAVPKKGSVRSGMPREDEELVGVSGIFRMREEWSIHSPADDNYDSLNVNVIIRARRNRDIHPN